jgi:Uma2 family endonuclease
MDFNKLGAVMMISAREHFPQFTPAEYLEWEAQQDLRYEYIEGRVRPIADETVDRIINTAANFSTLLQDHLRGTVCRVFGNRVKVQTVESNSFCYPDLSVSGDVHDRSANNFISHPGTIIEVLSPSTEAYDRGEKFGLYRSSPSLQEYVLVSTDLIHLDIHRQRSPGMWEFSSYSAGSVVELASLNFSFEIDRIYEHVGFEPAE